MTLIVNPSCKRIKKRGEKVHVIGQYDRKGKASKICNKKRE